MSNGALSRKWRAVRCWFRRRRERLVCRVFGHSFYQGIGGYGADGLPYPEKRCHYCDYSEDLS